MVISARPKPLTHFAYPQDEPGGRLRRGEADPEGELVGLHGPDDAGGVDLSVSLAGLLWVGSNARKRYGVSSKTM